MSLFSKVVSIVPKKHAFNLSFENKLTAEFGQLVPVMCKEVLPGDTWQVSHQILCRTAPMLAPVLSSIDIYLHTFFVPNRLLCSDWEGIITGGLDGTLQYTVPSATLSNFGAVTDGSLADFLGMPTMSSVEIASVTTGIGSFNVNLLPFLAYAKVYSDWFKDELLDSFEFEPVAQGLTSDSTLISALKTLRVRSWKKDYFTSARPNTQLGAEILVPASGTIVGNGPMQYNVPSSISTTGAVGIYTQDGDQQSDGSYNYPFRNASGNGSLQFAYAEGLSLEDVGVSVNDLRRSVRIQEWQEKNMRGGNRYIESIYHHFGVKSSDARLQRSEYICGSKHPVLVSEVAQTSSTDAAIQSGSTGTPQGNLSGKAIAVGNGGKKRFFAEEYGYIITIMSVMPKTSYCQGMPRMFWRQDKFDFAWPEFGNLGEQEVYKGELFFKQAGYDGTFGYQSRYADMKMSLNEIHSAFRSSMAYWHTARLFDSAPTLSNQFVQLRNGGAGAGNENSQPMNRIFATLPSGYGHFYCQIYNDLKVVRVLPKYGIPTL